MNNEVKKLIRAGALFVINHSGGKDSQAMTIFLKRLIPADQLIIIHSDLGEVEWDGCLELIERYAGDTNIVVTRANKTLLDMVDRRQQFPSPSNRQCTSDLKRDPIAKAVRAISKATGKLLIVHCMGMRAAESPNRAKLQELKLNKRESRAGRIVYDWLPIHNLTTPQVFQSIKRAGQEPHWVYAAGMSRKSCCFCIMSSKEDLRTAARLRPELAEKYMQREEQYGRTMMMPVKGKQVFLRDVINQQ